MVELNIERKIETIKLKETEYVIITKKEYLELLEKIEDLEDVIHIKNARLDNGKDYTIEDLEKEYEIKVNRYDKDNL